MRITAVSGKGGVGKSMVASSLAIAFARNHHVIAIDCDVDAPNLALWLGIDTSQKKNAVLAEAISTTSKPVINLKKCTHCGKCVEMCNFSALSFDEKRNVQLASYHCEGCGLCEYVCPSGAITLEPVNNCILSRYDTKWGFPVIQGQIIPGEAESGEVVTELRKYAKTFETKNDIIIQDAAAGIGCPIIASLRGSDLAVLVIEPTKSSLADAKRVLEVVDHFNIPVGFIINKYGLNGEMSMEIEKLAGERFCGRISYDRKIIKQIAKLTPIMESELESKEEIEVIFKRISDIINTI